VRGARFHQLGAHCKQDQQDREHQQMPTSSDRKHGRNEHQSHRGADDDLAAVKLGKKRVGDQHQNQREQELGDGEAEKLGRHLMLRRYPGRNWRVAVQSRFGCSFRGFLADGGLLVAHFHGGYGHREWEEGQAARSKVWNLRNSYPEHLTPGLRRHVPTSPAEVDRTPARTARLCDKALVRLGSDRPLGPGTGRCRNGYRGSGRGRGGRRGKPVWAGGALGPCSSSRCRLRRRPPSPLR